MEWILDDKEAKLRAASNLAAQEADTQKKLQGKIERSKKCVEKSTKNVQSRSG